MFSEQLTDPLFALALSRDETQAGFGGYLTLGGIPDISDPYINASSTFGSASFETSPEDCGSNQLARYLITADGISWSSSSGSEQAQSSVPFQYEVDSGTTLSQFPDSIATAANALFQPPATQNSNGLYVVSCDAIPPQLSVEIGGVILPVNPTDLIWNPENGACLSGIQAMNPSLSFGILGASVMQSLLTVFDWGEEQIHVASRPQYKS